MWKLWSGRYAGWHRLAYNLFALVTLLPVGIYLHTVRDPAVFSWSEFAVPVRGLLLSGSLLLFFYGSRRYDSAKFFGIAQIRGQEPDTLLSADGTFSTKGILGLIRHPWYAGGVLLIWSVRRDYSVPIIVLSSILTLYLITGAFLEERRLKNLYGEEYFRYQQEVSMFLPWKWFRKKLRK